MRKALTFALIVAMAVVGVPAVTLAQSQISSGSLSGRAVDAAGRGVSGQRVELMRGSLVVSADTTDSRGEWSFAGVAAGDYIVRVNVRGKIAGMRVSVGLGQAVTGTLIVVPTASVSPQLGTLASLLTMLPTAATAVTATTVVATVNVETTAVSETILVQILQQLSPEARQTFATEVLAAIAAAGSSQTANPFAQYQQQFQQIRDNPTAPLPTFPPPVPVS